MAELATKTEPASIHYRLLRVALDQFGKSPTGLDEQEYKQVRQIAAKEYLIEQSVLASEEARGVVVPASQVDKVVEQIASRYGDEDTFHQELADNQLRLQDLKVALERELRVEAVLALVASRTPAIDDTEANLFYYMNRDRFVRPEMRKARHILVTINPEFAENTREEALRRIEKIHQRVSKKPARFEEQAMKHSECPASMNGGLLGEVKDDTLYPELSAVLFKMKSGEVSEVIESPIGFHILFCESVTPGGIAPLADVIDKLRDQLQEKQRKLETRRWIKKCLQTQSEDEQESVRELA